MKYEIKGDNLPVVICQLEPGEVIVSEAGGRTWSRGNVQTDTASGGVGKALQRMISGESLFLSKYTAVSACEIAFTSCFPGSIIPVELQAGENLICQKSAFLAATESVDLSIHFQKKMGAGFFGGEGFIMQKVTGPGIVFLEIDGSAITYDLQAGEQLTCDTGVVAFMDATCSLDIQSVKGLKNIAFGGEGLFNTVITGPGKVTLQTMPISKFISMMPISNG